MKIDQNGWKIDQNGWVLMKMEDYFFVELPMDLEHFHGCDVNGMWCDGSLWSVGKMDI